MDAAFTQPAAFMQPAVIETYQPVNEVVIGPSGQPEYVQVVEQPVMDMGQPLVQGDVTYADPSQQAQEQAALAPRVVIVCTSADMLGDHPTGAWSEEITGPFYVFRDAGCEIYFASIAGGPVPIDQGSLAHGMVTENDQRFHEEGGFDLLQDTLPISNIRAEDIDCVWLAGGHGTMVDFEQNLAQFITDAVAYGRPVGAVCHGVAGLLSAIKEDCTPLLQGRQVTAFSNAEEDMVQLSEKVPYLLQSRIEELGAAYSCTAPWQEYALADGPIITGQNPASSVRAAQLCIQAMTPQQ
jgi:putative intracellular protease/amidase